MIEFVNYFTVSALSLLTGFSIGGVVFWRYQRNALKQSLALNLVLGDKANQISEQRKALQELIYQFHHSGLNPKCKRLRGISYMGLRSIKMLTQNLELLCRPHHNPNVKLVIEDVDEIEIWWRNSIQVCLDIEKEVLDSANKFNHLQ